MRRGLRTWRSDHAHTESPNAGHPMAMAAGLLGVRLDKPGHYVLGERLATPGVADIDRSIALCARAGHLALLSAALGLYVLGGQLV
jgi:adenosylcobinamide-phosphate synthase